MRKISNFLSSNQLQAANILDFPYDLLSEAPWGILYFRLCVDALNGDDNNNGFTWESPKKSIQAAIDALPNDMQYYTAFIFVHSGTYDPFKIYKSNGTILLYWVADFMNTSSYSDAIYARGNSVNPFRDANPIDIVLTDANSNLAGGLCVDAMGLNLRVEILSKNEGIPSPWSSAYIYADRWVFKTDNIVVKPALLSFNCFLYALHFRLELGKCSEAGIWLRGSYSACDIASMSVLGGSGNASVSNGDWKGAIVIMDSPNSFIIGNTSYGFHASYNNNGNYFYFDAVKQVFHNPRADCKLALINPLSMNSVNDVGATKPQFKLASNFSGTCQYHSDNALLSDASTYPHTIVDKKTSTSTVFVDSLLKRISTSLFQKVHTSAPADASFANQEVALYLDETGNKLKFKLKYAAGTVKTGEIALL